MSGAMERTHRKETPHGPGRESHGECGLGNDLTSAECRQFRAVADVFVLVTVLEGCLEGGNV
jgi:hypothetical protein